MIFSHLLFDFAHFWLRIPLGANKDFAPDPGFLSSTLSIGKPLTTISHRIPIVTPVKRVQPEPSTIFQTPGC